MQARNSLWIGGETQFGDPDDTTCLAWSPLEPNPLVWDHVLFYQLKATPETCPPQSLCDIPPGLADERIETFNPQLTAGSPAVDAGALDGAPGEDLTGRARDGQPDLGAFELWTPSTWLYLPVVHKS